MFKKTPKRGPLRCFSVNLLFIWCFLSSAMAGDVQTPHEIAGGKVLSVSEAKRMLEANDANFIDTRNIFNYGKGHLPRAIQISYSQKSRLATDFDQQLDSFDLSKLPNNKQTKLVFYSHGSTGWKSYKAAVMAIEAGYSKVFWFRTGYQSWLEAGHEIELTVAN